MSKRIVRNHSMTAKDRYQLFINSYPDIGTAEIAGQALEKRDGLGIWNIEDFEFKADTSSRILLMEVPIQLS